MQLKLPASLFGFWGPLHFTKNGDEHAQVLANAVVITTQLQGDRLKSAVGKSTSPGALVTQADIDKLVAQKILSFGYWFALAARDNAVASASSASARVAPLTVLATAKLGSDGIASDASALTALAHIRLSQPGDGFMSGVESAWLSVLNFNASNDVYARHYISNAAESTPVANSIRLRSSHYRNYLNGDVATRATNDAASTLHWTGSSWKVCGINDADSFTVPDANGNSSYNHCDSLEQGTISSRTVDISGQTMVDVYQSMKSQGYTNMRIGASSLAASALLGAAVFPNGSRMVMKKALNTSNAFAYYPGRSSRLKLPDAQLAAGDSNTCKNASADSFSLAVKLETVVERLRGTPCTYPQFSAIKGLNGVLLNTGSRNEAWESTTLGLGILGNAPTVATVEQASTFYTGNTHVRVAFGDASLAKYYTCQESWGGSVRNCTPAGTGRYVIETLGDARVLHFTGLPQILQGAKTWERVFVQRGGNVFYGYRDLPYPAASAWLNLPATNALSTQLGIRIINPADQLALTVASYEGTYKGAITGTVGNLPIAGEFTFTFTPGQAPTCTGKSNALVNADNPNGNFTCTNVVLNPGEPGITQASISFGTTSSGDSFNGTVDYYTGHVEGGWTSTAVTGASGTFTGERE